MKKLALKMEFAMSTKRPMGAHRAIFRRPIRRLALFRLDGQGRQQSLTSEMKLPPESDTESIADYADGNDGGEA